MNFAVRLFAPIALRLLKVGPFQSKELVIPFDDGKPEPSPTNVFLIAAVNGLGKTTLLEAVVACMALLEGDLAGPPPAPPGWLDDHPDARLQLDVLVELAEPGAAARRGVLSLILCEAAHERSPGLQYWTSDMLQTWSAEFNARINVYRPEGPRVWQEVAFDAQGEDDPHAVALVRGLRDHIQRAKRNPVGADLMAPSEDAPAVLMFTSHRDLAPRVHTSERVIRQPPEWAHSLVRRFDNERGWSSSLDALLVYLDYIDGRRSPGMGEPRFNQARDLLNEHLFLDEEGLPAKTLLKVDREQMATLIEVKTPNPDGGEPLTTTHSLDRLSSGEKAFAQLLVRLGAHMTTNTLVLIDEADLHLHPRWERGLMWTIKRLAKDHAGLRFIVVTHSIDMIKGFDRHREELGLTKEGYILDGDAFQGEVADGR